MRWRRGVAAGVVLAIAVLAAGCGVPAGGGMTAAGGGDAVTGDAVTGEVTVLAAASLTDAFAAMGAAFAEAHPAATATFGFAGSQTLATQVLQGAAADVVASADATHVDRLAAEGLLEGQPTPFATNQLAIAVEAGNPHGVRTLADLADPQLVVVLAAPEVPAGRATAAALDAAEVVVAPASLELDVRSALARVELGEADAAVVYASDLLTAGQAVEGVAIPSAEATTTAYPIAVLADAPNPAAARAFVALVRSAEGQAILQEHGLGPPPP